MRAGITGFRRVGKTTIFNALTGLEATVGGYQGEGGKQAKPNLGVIKVPDPRIEYLAQLYQPRKVTYAEVAFVDVPGREGSEKALDQRTVAEMRNVDALVQVVGDFADPQAVTHASALSQLEEFHSEIILADMAVIEKRLERLRKEGKKDQEAALLARIGSALDAGTPVRDVALTEAERGILAGFSLLSQMPLLVLLNVDEARVGDEPVDELRRWTDVHGVGLLVMCGKVEMELAQLAEEERAAFAAELGVGAVARERFLRAVYKLLDLVSFLTAGPQEVRAWTIPRGTTAVEAARRVHSDIARGFIRAEVISYGDFARFGSEAACRNAGKLRIEGKDAVINDGDIVHFRFNV